MIKNNKFDEYLKLKGTEYKKIPVEDISSFIQFLTERIIKFKDPEDMALFLSTVTRKDITFDP